MPRTTTPPSRDYFLGCDPGKSGAFAMLGREGNVIAEMRCTETITDIGSFLRQYRTRISFALIEQVGAMPTDARSSAFKFGDAFGWMRGMITVCNIRHEYIRPVKWQSAMECRTGGDKNISKAKAQTMFPDYKGITGKGICHSNADALLLAELARRTGLERGW